MRVLLIGRGGREHALAWKLCQTAQHVFVVPGNGGTAAMAPNVSNVEHADMHDFQSLVALARTLAVDLVLPGPDDVVVEGIADVFEQAGIPCFAPSKAAAKLEGSKTFAKDFMRRYDIPTAEYRNFDTYEHARDYLSSINHRVVIKVSGLAAGKGVVLPETQGKAQRELREMMVDKKFGHQEVVIEEFLSGDEISILTFSDGHTFRSLPPVQDHKRIFNGSEGPNTGGMGVYGPVDFVSRELMAQMEKDIIVPTFQGLRSDAHVFRGILFTGVMITPKGPKALEYNVRFGDPETQSLIPLLDTSTNLADIYIQIFHAGTVRLGDELRTAGGRVFAVAAVRASLAEAVHAAYEGVSCIAFEGMQYRSDIASRCLTTSDEKRDEGHTA
ncbi:Bifunctional purine biosynthetic protein ADE1 like [Verticillium longisporum]|nr:Bifunctional purine biosynthetic protein ADE1 like [Verticillium longisporum]